LHFFIVKATPSQSPGSQHAAPGGGLVTKQTSKAPSHRDGHAKKPGLASMRSESVLHLIEDAVESLAQGAEPKLGVAKTLNTLIGLG